MHENHVTASVRGYQKLWNKQAKIDRRDRTEPSYLFDLVACISVSACIGRNMIYIWFAFTGLPHCDRMVCLHAVSILLLSLEVSSHSTK